MNIENIDKTFIRIKYSHATAVVSCIQSVANFYGRRVSPDEIQQKLSFDKDGFVSLQAIATVIHFFGLTTVGVRLNHLDGLEEILNPGIILINVDEHKYDFVIYYGKYENKYLIGDPAWGLNLYNFMLT